MGKYLGPKIKIIRRLGLLPGLTQKVIKNKENTPGQHGKLISLNFSKTRLKDDYREKLFEKQKLCFNYGLTENQLRSYYKKAKENKKPTGLLLLQLLESRLDCIIYRLGFASTIPFARQIVNHKHILVNNKVVNIPSFLCSKNDKITICNSEQSQNLIRNNFNIYKQKYILIKRRIKTLNLLKSRFLKLIPTHLKLDSKIFVATIMNYIEKKDILLPINELKIVEYYSKFL